MKPRTFATAWVTNDITWEDEPMQIIVRLISHLEGIVFYHQTCRSIGPPVYQEFEAEFGLDDKDLALKYWEEVKTGDGLSRTRIIEKFSDLFGYGIPF